MTKTNVDMGAGVEVERDWGGGVSYPFFFVCRILLRKPGGNSIQHRPAVLRA